MNEILLKTSSVEETEAIGEVIGKNMTSGSVIALDGDLGAGKTAITRGFARGMGLDDFVSSPTFTIVNEYISGAMPLYHFDTYRLSDEEDFLNSGLDEYFYNGGVCVIEWSSVISGVLPEDTIKMEIRGVGDTREITIKVTEKYNDLIETLKEKFL